MARCGINHSVCVMRACMALLKGSFEGGVFDLLRGASKMGTDGPGMATEARRPVMLLLHECARLCWPAIVVAALVTHVRLQHTAGFSNASVQKDGQIWP